MKRLEEIRNTFVAPLLFSLNKFVSKPNVDVTYGAFSSIKTGKQMSFSPHIVETPTKNLLDKRHSPKLFRALNSDDSKTC